MYHRSVVSFVIVAIAFLVNIGGGSSFLVIQKLVPCCSSTCVRAISFQATTTNYRRCVKNIHKLNRAKASDDDDPPPTARGSSTVEDGSPIGVAIVVIGGFLTLQFKEKTDSVVWDDSYIWAVFCTASISVGALRLARYILQNKK